MYNPNSHIGQLGLVSTTAKRIKPLGSWKKYFDLSKTPTKTTVLQHTGDVFDTIGHIKEIVRTTSGQTSRIATALKGRTLADTLRNNWNFVYEHIAYELDQDGIEQLREPNRLIKDLKGDCDCFSIFISSLLHNQGIPHKFRITKYNGKSNYQHIYIIVPKQQGKGHYTLDAVLDSFNEEKPYSQKLDIDMQIAQLSGFGDTDVTPIGEEFNFMDSEISGLGMTEEQKAVAMYWKGVRKMVSNSMAVINAIPHHERTAHDLRMMNRLTRLLGVIHVPSVRDVLLDELMHEENQEEFVPSLDEEEEEVLNGLYGGDEFDLMINDVFNEELGGLGFFKKLRRKVKSRVNKTFSAIKKGATAVKTGVVRFGKKAGEVVKKVGAFVMKYNPATALIRNGLLLAFKINLLLVSEKIGYGLWSREEAVSKGLDLGQWEKAKKVIAFVEKIHKGLGGNIDSLHKNIKQGFDHGVRKHDLLHGALGEPATATATAPAMGIIGKIIHFIKTIGLKVVKAVKKVVTKVKENPALKQFAKKGIQNLTDRATGNQQQSLIPEVAAVQQANVRAGRNMNDGIDPSLLNTPPKAEKSNTVLYASLGLGAAAVLYFATQNNNNSKPVNGVSGTKAKTTSTKRRTTRKSTSKKRSTTLKLN